MIQERVKSGLERARAQGKTLKRDLFKLKHIRRF
jgi:DNA invertase Pin-like site-specific DNA recombinase